MGVSENTAVITKAYTAYVYRYDGSTWIEEAKLESSHHASDFGICAVLFGDIALVGADLDNHNGPHSGSVYAFHGLSDCQPNATIDICDITDGTSDDANGNGIPDECECSGDLDGDGDVDLSDLAILLGAYNATDAGDLDGDSDTDISDLAMLLANYGEVCW